MLKSPNSVHFISHLKNKRLHSGPSRPVISNSGVYAENISAFVDFHHKSIATKVKSYIKDTNDFLRKHQDLPKLPDDVILCTINDGLLFLKKALDKLPNKTISVESLIKVTNLV